MTDKTILLLHCLQKQQEIAAVVKQLYLHMLEEKKQQKEYQQHHREAPAAHHQQQLVNKQKLHRTSFVQEQEQQQGIPPQQQPLDQHQHQHGAVGIHEAKVEQSRIVQAAADGTGAPLVVSDRASNPTGPGGTDRHLWEQLIERLGSVYSKYL